jgi:hypothetical protein
MMSKSRRVLCVALSLVVLGAGGAALYLHDDAGRERPAASSGAVAPQYIEALTLFPDDLRAVASLADTVAVFSVVSDRDMGLPPDQAARGEGYAGREVLLRVERVVWTRPGSSAPPMPPTILTRVAGSIYRDGKPTPATFEGGPRLTPGQRAIAPFAYLTPADNVPNNVGWIPYNPATTSLLAGDTSVNVPDGVSAKFANMTTAQVAGTVAAAQPYAAAAAHPEASASERYQQIYGRLLSRDG